MARNSSHLNHDIPKMVYLQCVQLLWLLLFSHFKGKLNNLCVPFSFYLFKRNLISFVAIVFISSISFHCKASPLAETLSRPKCVCVCAFFHFVSASRFPFQCKAANHSHLLGQIVQGARVKYEHSQNNNDKKTTLFSHYLLLLLLYSVWGMSIRLLALALTLFVCCVFFSRCFAIVFHLYLKISQPYLSFRMRTCTMYIAFEL